MRCPKCGYVSFDHLEKCLKCSRDLAPTRQDLNLVDFRPEVPFLLGSLVGEMEGGGGGYEQELSLTQETELELGGFDEGTTPAEENIDMQGMGGSTDLDSSEDLKLSEIALDDFAGISGEEAGGSEEGDEFLGLEFDSDDIPLEDLGELDESMDMGPAVESTEGAASSDSGMDLDLNDDDLSALAQELEGHLESEASGKKKAAADDSIPGLDDVILEMEDD